MKKIKTFVDEAKRGLHDTTVALVTVILAATLSVWITIWIEGIRW